MVRFTVSFHVVLLRHHCHSFRSFSKKKKIYFPFILIYLHVFPLFHNGFSLWFRFVCFQYLEDNALTIFYCFQSALSHIHTLSIYESRMKGLDYMWLVLMVFKMCTVIFCLDNIIVVNPRSLDDIHVLLLLLLLLLLLTRELIHFINIVIGCVMLSFRAELVWCLD